MTEYFKSNGKGATMKFHDPSYMIRSVPANAADRYSPLPNSHSHCCISRSTVVAMYILLTGLWLGMGL
jgi:hypothetical protein